MQAQDEAQKAFKIEGTSPTVVNDDEKTLDFE